MLDLYYNYIDICKWIKKSQNFCFKMERNSEKYVSIREFWTKKIEPFFFCRISLLYSRTWWMNGTELLSLSMNCLKCVYDDDGSVSMLCCAHLEWRISSVALAFVLVMYCTYENSWNCVLLSFECAYFRFHSLFLFDFVHCRCF